MKVVIAGAGFSGAVFARIAAEAGHSCTVFDSRAHLGGNAADRTVAGIRVHSYGPHYFRTDSREVIAFLSRFCRWRRLTYRVMAGVGRRLVRFPVSAATYEDLFGRRLSPAAWQAELRRRAIVPPAARPPRNAEEWLLSRVGREFYELFYEGYTCKQWGLHPRELSPEIVARVPVRLDNSWRYLNAGFQALPAEGYTRLFERLLAHPRIQLRTATAWDGSAGDLLVYTGPLDAFFGYSLGRLRYRSLEFRTRILPAHKLQPCGQVNYPRREVPFTRRLEWKHLGGPTAKNTVITWEYPRSQGEPFYPMPTPDDEAHADLYRKMAARQRRVIFLGRLATYRYINMDEAVRLSMLSAQALL